MTIEQIHKIFLKSNSVCTDTRNLKKGELFFALKGDNFNGNKFAQQAVNIGASFAIIDEAKYKTKNCILVTNVLSTLQKLASFHREYLNIPIIALTGSNGKTTTKELIHTILSKKYACTSTKGNLNNHIGVPLTLLSMNTNTEIGVVEMGANHLKEIETLCAIAKPNYGYITNIGKAHLEGFGSEHNILIGKTELYKAIQQNRGTIFCNSEDQKLLPLALKMNHILFSKKNNNYLGISILETSPFVKVKFDKKIISSNLIGAYNYTNIAASIAIGNYFKINTNQIKEAIENYIPINNRSELIQKDSIEIILDAYNANPSSMSAALSNLINIETSKSQKTIILGDMFELGMYAKQEHQQIVNLITNSNINNIFLVGNHFSECHIDSEKIKVFTDTISLLLYFKNHVIKDSLILIKGSRGMKLEQIVPLL